MHQMRKVIYTTSTVIGWQSILLDPEIIVILMDAWKFLVDSQRISLYSFVIMPNHIHWMYEVYSPYENGQIKHSFLSYTSKKILEILSENKDIFYVEKSNRMFQIWKSPSLSVEIFSKDFYYQKLNYIHNNPVKADLCSSPEEYLYSSALSYLSKEAKFPFLTVKKF
jgi:REP element-mobilizing transposase RayT